MDFMEDIMSDKAKDILLKYLIHIIKERFIQLKHQIHLKYMILIWL